MPARLRYLEMQNQKGTQDSLEAEALTDRGHDIDRAAALALLSTCPTTAEGAAALLTFVREQEEEKGNEILNLADDEGTPGSLLLIAALEKYFVRSV